MTPEGRFAAALEDLLPDHPRRLVLAVSGGGDSMALMHLAHGWAEARGVALDVVTVDHGLRPEATAEAAMVAGAAAALGLSHRTLRWEGGGASGNLQDAARRARRTLIEDWARDLQPDAILTGHTLDDQAETVLLRLARGSGVDGLAGMAPARHWRALWLRPLLDLRRDELRAWLTQRGIAWAEDPSNADPRFDRVRARAMLDGLATLGLGPERLAATARHMALAREVLEDAARRLAADAVRVDAGDLVIARAPFAATATETRTRLLAAALQWVSGAPYRPRYAATLRLAAAGSGVLHGCLVTADTETMRIAREPAAVRDLAVRPGEIWDGRWQLEGPATSRMEIRTLGRDGLAACAAWREADLPAPSLQASPAVWRGADLVAAPLAGMGRGWTARLVHGRDEFII